MTFEVLVATMHQKDKNLLDRMNICSDAVIVNQCDSDSVEIIKWKDFSVKWINTTERGLSRSRNMAIRNADADICLIADDDEIFIDGYAELIKNTFYANPSASIIRFRVNTIEQGFENNLLKKNGVGRPQKIYPLKTQKIGYLRSLKVASFEIAFRLKDIKENSLVFDELIGAGTQFLMGEENSFLFRCLEKKLKMIYVPETVAGRHVDDSTWFTGYNTQFFIGKGASFTSINKKFSSLLIFQWALRKRGLYRGISVIEAIKTMKKGKKMYLDKKKERLK